MCMVAFLPPAKKLSLPWCSAGRLESLLDAIRLNLNMVCSKFEYQYTGGFFRFFVCFFVTCIPKSTNANDAQ